ncbi:MAG: hypothetical protein SGI74_09170 [Oligoflexia bacterium]|nr:hypothetical protein [Oligoflexia bacterium]
MLSVNAAKMLVKKHGSFTVAQLLYNAAGDYPICYSNLTDVEKLTEKQRIIKQNLKHLVDITKILKPKYMMPFAGHYVLGGKLWDRNRFLAHVTWDKAAQFVTSELHEQKTLVLNEGLTFDLVTEKITNGTYVPIDEHAMTEYISSVLRSLKYSYEFDLDTEASNELKRFIRKSLQPARMHLWNIQSTKLQSSLKWNIYIDLEEEYFSFNLSSSDTHFVAKDVKKIEPCLVAKMDNRLLCMILKRQAHWDNALTGCHIDFTRYPNVYEPDILTLLCFFHLPAETKC